MDHAQVFVAVAVFGWDSIQRFTEAFCGRELCVDPGLGFGARLDRQYRKQQQEQSRA